MTSGGGMPGAGGRRAFRIHWAALGLAAGILTLGLLSGGARAQIPESLAAEVESLPVLLSADEVIYDEDLGTVTASGKVELSQGGRTLFADSVSYNLRSGQVAASGNVTLLDSAGNAYFAEYVELTDDMREGFIRDVNVLLTDRSRIAAVSGSRRKGRITEFRKAVFSPCELCREDPTRAPLWQLKADRVVHDQEDRVIRYYNAWMEFYGVPVAYTPYFEHPDPTVKRKSGLLAPIFGSSTLLGKTLQTPYYWNIAPDKDATFQPIFTTKQSVVLGGEYRQLLTNGRLEVRGSATIADRGTGDEIQSDQLRGHIDARGRFDIDERWRWGFDIERASDETYLRLYDFSDEPTLTSKLFAESLSGRDYASANLFLYQGLREEDRNEEFPIIAPLLDYNLIGEPDSRGGRYTLDANVATLARIEGRDVQRFSLKGGWEVPHVGAWGGIYRLMANVQADGYFVHEFDPNSNDVNPTGATESDLTGRFFPQLALQWRYPWIRPSSFATQVVEPIVQLVAAPDWANNDDIPNEDSLDFEFDDTNLFSLNRFTGLDRIDPGSRVDYGLKWTVSSPVIGQSSAFVGQSFRLERDDAFVAGSGLEDNFSDIVGRLRLQPHQDIDLSYRFRFDKGNFGSQRSELDLRVGPPALRVNLDYIFIDNEVGTDDFEDREELTVQVSSQLNENWSTFARHKRDLEANDSLSTSLGLTYENECLVFELVGRRSFFEDREIEPEDSVMLRLVFKYLGGVSTE